MSTGVEEEKDPTAGPAMQNDKSVGDAEVAIAKAGLQSVPLAHRRRGRGAARQRRHHPARAATA